jgi:two-component system NarL family sensor kinase
MSKSSLILPIIFTTLTIVFLVAGVAISFFITGRQRVKQQMELTEARLNYEKELRQVEVEVSENMTQQFARELHDNIGHILTCMRLTIENKKLDNPEMEASFAPVEVYLEQATGQLSLLSRSLNTDYISGVGLSAAVQLEVDRLRQLRKYEVHLEQQGTQSGLDKNQELMVFRIFQEMIHNSLKHARANNLYISVSGGTGFELKVFDDGKGFDTKRILGSGRASGLKNMIKRADMAGLTCVIDSAEGDGCRCILRQKKTVRGTDIQQL